MAYACASKDFRHGGARGSNKMKLSWASNCMTHETGTRLRATNFDGMLLREFTFYFSCFGLLLRAVLGAENDHMTRRFPLIIFRKRGLGIRLGSRSRPAVSQIRNPALILFRDR